MNRNKLTAAFALASSLIIGGCSNETAAPIDIQEKEAHWSVIYQKVADGATGAELDILSDPRFGSRARYFAHIDNCRIKYLDGTDIKTSFDTAKKITLCSVEQARDQNKKELRDTLNTGFAFTAGLISAITALNLYSRRREKIQTNAPKN